ncbi:MAG TPA: class I SAM-dependent methyltransferase, partial [Bdellovibrio sp.]|nr:class I SAM-dependent methyltransferase [Bdellovibrio sp.]
MDEIEDIEQYYQLYDEEGRLDRNQLEFEITWKYLKEYLPKSGKILELGAATGKYTEGLSQMGFCVHAIDLSSNLIEQAKLRLSKITNHNATFEVRDARDLSHIPSDSFDAVLVMGPLYHLVEKADRIHLLKECRRVLKPHGLFLSTHITRLGVFGHMLNKYPNWINQQDEINAILRTGSDSQIKRTGNFRAYFVNADEVAPEIESVGFKTKSL